MTPIKFLFKWVSMVKHERSQAFIVPAEFAFAAKVINGLLLVSVSKKFYRLVVAAALSGFLDQMQF